MSCRQAKPWLLPRIRRVWRRVARHRVSRAPNGRDPSIPMCFRGAKLRISSQIPNSSLLTINILTFSRVDFRPLFPRFCPLLRRLGYRGWGFFLFPLVMSGLCKFGANRRKVCRRSFPQLFAGGEPPFPAFCFLTYTNGVKKRFLPFFIPFTVAVPFFSLLYIRCQGVTPISTNCAAALRKCAVIQKTVQPSE